MKITKIKLEMKEWRNNYSTIWRKKFNDLEQEGTGTGYNKHYYLVKFDNWDTFSFRQDIWGYTVFLSDEDIIKRYLDAVKQSKK